jgi:hypothetical protein
VYAERIDAGDFEGVAELFEHGRISTSPDLPPAETFEGRDGVLAMYRSTTRLHGDGTPLTHHVVTNAVIEVEDGADAATARSRYTVFQQVEKLPLQPIVAGRYHDTFRLRDGRWCFDTRIMIVDRVGDLSRHLLFDLGDRG